MLFIFCYFLEWIRSLTRKKCYSEGRLVKQPLFEALARKWWESTDGSESRREKLWKKQDSSEGGKSAARNRQPHDEKRIKATCISPKLATWIQAKDQSKISSELANGAHSILNHLLWPQSILPNFLKAVKGLHICQHLIVFNLYKLVTPK